MAEENLFKFAYDHLSDVSERFEVNAKLGAAIKLVRSRAGLHNAVRQLSAFLDEDSTLFGNRRVLVDYVLNAVEASLEGGMKDEKIISAFKACEERLRKGWYVPSVLTGQVGFEAKQDEVPGNRALWCAVEGPKLVLEGRREKAMRWLGFVQGVTFTLGLATVEDIKNDSKPDEQS